MPLTVTHLVLGPDDHGVVLFGRELAAQEGGPLVITPAADHPAVHSADLVHLQFTDALYGRNCAEAAQTFAELAATLPGPRTVTLHDLPDPDDEPGRYRRRSAAYRVVVAAVDGVVVSSQHEARLLELIGGGTASVVPLPVDPVDPVPYTDGDTDEPTPGDRPEIGVLGFVHPGKGHAEALTELIELGHEISFTAVGRAADGHAGMVDDLTARAAEAGLDWNITGFVDPEKLPARLRRVTVPLAPGRLISASGSVNTWLANGRRPLVLEGPYTREIARRRPGAVTLYQDGTLAHRVRDALSDPASTWLPPGQDIGPGRAETAAAYRRFFAEVAAG